MTDSLTIALLYGGPSGEHEISLQSAASVLRQLDPKRYHVVPIGIDKAGLCFYNPRESLAAELNSLPVQGPQARALPSLLVNGKFVMDVDLVFPLVHGPLLEDGALQGLLELAQIPYIGSPVLGSAIGMDKDLSRQLVSLDGIRSTAYHTLARHTLPLLTQEFYTNLLQTLGLPVFVKPCCMGSSVGIHKVTHIDDLAFALSDAAQFDDTILIEQAILGREVEVAILEQPDHTLLASIPGELKIHHPDGFYSYDAKYIDTDLTELCIPAILPPTTVKALQQAAKKIFTRLKCQGMARVDFFVQADTNDIYFSEINTLPGFTHISMYPRLMMHMGLSYTELLDQLIQGAWTRHQQQPQRQQESVA